MSDPHDRHHPVLPSDRPAPHPATAHRAHAQTTTVQTTARTTNTNPATALDPESSDPDSPAVARPEFPQPQYHNAQNRHSILLVAAVAAASLGLGGYFLLSSKSNAASPAAYANQTSRITVEITGGTP